ncbi:hypothetical protein [Spirosoma validum]|uniref:Uncharacterized protein n=1 Tax=Spirosoma validum TaxID=2771355 RepID=A0A927B2V8_9BACT|nr:hypothetical protein [Spirosoma validum]MBD2754323.1 hypothetical protein [Spirosoma validum]
MIYRLFTGLLLLTTASSFGQRQEFSISPVGFIYTQNQLVQPERYVASRQSLTVSFSYNDSQRNYAVIPPPRTDRFSSTRGVAELIDIVGSDIFYFKLPHKLRRDCYR